jgi:hypothetical protein
LADFAERDVGQWERLWWKGIRHFGHASGITPLELSKLRTVERRCNDMRTYERPTLTAAGTFRKTGIGFRAGPERFWFFRRRFF